MLNWDNLQKEYFYFLILKVYFADGKDYSTFTLLLILLPNTLAPSPSSNSLCLSLGLLLSAHIFFLFYWPSNHVQFQLRLFFFFLWLKRRLRGGRGAAVQDEQPDVHSASTQLAQPTQTNKQHCLFRSRARALFHVFHSLIYTQAHTPPLPPSLSLLLSLGLTAPFASIKQMMKLSSQQKHFSAWINC